MAWRTSGKNRIYRRTIRCGDKFRSESFTGVEADLAAAIDLHRRAERQVRIDASNDAAARWADLNGRVRDFDQVCLLYLRTSLTAAGIRQHAGGAWRRWRMS